jgi:hypothetical protein
MRAVLKYQVVMMRGLDYLVESDDVLMLEMAMRADFCLEHFHVAASELF